ncbi:MAG: MBOAT family protein, partial [Planctomycetes bacterium]|nr:MBOAT family protein [Planctomycetota bacterium]
MLFHSWTFALFFALFYPIFLFLRRTRLRLPWLLLASYVFYAAWSPIYLALIAFSTLIDYAAGRGIASGRGRRAWLGLSIAADIGVLGFFKYGAFVADSLTDLFARLGIPYAVPAPGIVLSVGISFYVFRSLTYTIDLYRGQIEVERNFLRYATFVALFPPLLMGPIERAKSLLPQLREAPRIGARDIADGLSLFAAGIFKKVALADALALYVDSIYISPGSHESPALIA